MLGLIEVVSYSYIPVTTRPKIIEGSTDPHDSPNASPKSLDLTSEVSPSIPSFNIFLVVAKNSDSSTQLPIVVYHTAIMASTEEYALLCLENPLLGECPISRPPSQRLR